MRRKKRIQQPLMFKVLATATSADAASPTNSPR